MHCIVWIRLAYKECIIIIRKLVILVIKVVVQSNLDGGAIIKYMIGYILKKVPILNRLTVAFNV